MPIKLVLSTVLVAISCPCHAMERDSIRQGTKQEALSVDGKGLGGSILGNSQCRVDPVKSVCPHPDGKRLVVAFCHGVVSLMDMKTGARSDWKEKGETDLLRITPGGEYVLGVTPDHKAIVVRDAETGEFIRKMGEDVHYLIRDFCIAPEGDFIYVGYSKECIRRLEIETGKCIESFNIGQKDSIHYLKLSSTGRFLSCKCGETMLVWDLKTGLRHTVIGDGVFCVSSDEKYFIWGFKRPCIIDFSEQQGTIIKIFDLKDKKFVCEYITNHSVASLCTSISGDYLFFGTSGGVIMIFELLTGRLVDFSEKVNDSINCMEITPNGDHVVFCAREKIIVSAVGELIRNFKNGNSKAKTEKQIGGKRKRGFPEEGKVKKAKGEQEVFLKKSGGDSIGDSFGE